MFKTSLCPRTWRMQRDSWGRNENDKRNFSCMIKIWQIEPQEQHRPIMGLLRETLYFNRNKILIKIEEKWLHRLKLRGQRTCRMLRNLYLNNRLNLRPNRERSINKLFCINRRWETSISTTMGRWLRRRRIWISLTFRLLETKKQTCIQWFLESTILTLSAPTQWTEFETLLSFQQQGPKQFCHNYTKILKIIPSRTSFMIEVSPFLSFRSNWT